ncbi:glucose-1-phosphate cytidylyltransferase [Pelagibacterales bacterium]|nr:glucose-1-phosphate cytidylyltransferase [Pelagibacterales bacterium]
MKVILLAGGFGTRLGEYTDVVPKPMIEIGGKPVLLHIMNIYARFGHNEFYVALGYKSEVIKKFFINYKEIDSNLSIDLKKEDIEFYENKMMSWNINLIDTGINTMTGGRVKRMKEFIGDETFMLTYGDGLSNIDIDSLIKFHRSHGKMITVSAVRPPARFGELELDDNKVKSFEEKPQLQRGWINGGFFVVEPKFLDFIDDDNTLLEREPIEKATKEGELMAYKHEGFWQCMDNKRDLELLQKLWKTGAPWI